MYCIFFYCRGVVNRKVYSMDKPENAYNKILDSDDSMDISLSNHASSENNQIEKLCYKSMVQELIPSC